MEIKIFQTVVDNNVSKFIPFFLKKTWNAFDFRNLGQVLNFIKYV